MITVLQDARVRMQKALEISKTDLSSIRSGRATPALVENIIVSAYGGTQKLKVMELATINVMDVKTLSITPYDPATISEIEKGIQDAHVGLSPLKEGEYIRISLPPLSEERRFEYLKLAKAKLESGRVMIRQIRHEAMKELQKLSDTKFLTEDQMHHEEKQVQLLTDEVIAEIDMLGVRKEAELLQV
jgi:ribosome recycling factor